MTTEDRLNAKITAVADALEGMRTDNQALQGHTPQWYIRESTSGNWGIWSDASAHEVARTTDKANAKLIAAAPDLLEAAMAALDYYAQNENDDAPTAIELRAAIRKATNA